MTSLLYGSARHEQQGAGEGGRPLIQDFLQFEGRVDKGVRIVALMCEAVMRGDEAVDGQYELFAYRPVDRGLYQVDEIARSWVFG